jgi:hypothetical protein
MDALVEAIAEGIAHAVVRLASKSKSLAHDRKITTAFRCYQPAPRKRPSLTPLSSGKAMEPYQWFWLGVMAGFIPCFVVLVVIVTRASGCIKIRRRGRNDHNHP